MFKRNCCICLMIFSNLSIATQLPVKVEVQVVDPMDKPLQNIVVYIEPISIATIDTVFTQQKKTQIEISQKDKAFIPYISVIQKGQPVIFNNHDEITHHIFSASKEQSFSFKIRSDTTNQENQFNQVANISMGCNIHDWMSGYLLVVDTPFFEKTNHQGITNFELNYAGKVKVKIWHPQLMENESNVFKEIELNGRQQTIQFKLQNSLAPIPQQESGDDFDFLDSY